MNPLYTAEATVTGGRDGHARSADGVIDIDIKPPKELGGPGGQATNPEQLLAAGYAACFGNAAHLVARRMKKDPKDMSVTAHVVLGGNDDGTFGLAAELHVTAPRMSREDAEEVVAKAHTVCPFSKAFKGNIDVKLVVEDTAGAGAEAPVGIGLGE